MILGSAAGNLPIFVLFGLMAASLAGLLLLPALPQDQSYHLFADCRAIAGIPNFWNVVSNLPFIAIGAAGLRRFHDDPATIVLFLGFLLTGIGSSYYHWDPNDDTLFWDRLPMTFSFAAILALVVKERVSAKAGALLLWPALAIGLFSLLLWRSTDDLRLYFWVQFSPASQCCCCFSCARRSTLAHIIGSALPHSTRSPKCLNFPTVRFIRPATS